MPKALKLTDKDHGAKKLIALLVGMEHKKPSIEVGVLQDAGGNYPGGTTVQDIATYNEFGTVTPEGKTHVPARSFIRAWFDEHKVDGHARLAKLMQRVLKGELTEEAALEQFGLWAQGSIQQRISSSIPPENAKSTADRKGSTTTLIENGTLRSSISFRVK